MDKYILTLLAFSNVTFAITDPIRSDCETVVQKTAIAGSDQAERDLDISDGTRGGCFVEQIILARHSVYLLFASVLQLSKHQRTVPHPCD